jgi:branched-chain amino acid aminotransferase
MAKPVIKPYAPFLLDLSKSFPLWSSYFEGMKAYKDESDDVFCPDENYKRFNNSAFRMAMPEVPELFSWMG